MCVCVCEVANTNIISKVSNKQGAGKLVLGIHLNVIEIYRIHLQCYFIVRIKSSRLSVWAKQQLECIALGENKKTLLLVSCTKGTKWMICYATLCATSRKCENILDRPKWGARPTRRHKHRNENLTQRFASMCKKDLSEMSSTHRVYTSVVHQYQ